MLRGNEDYRFGGTDSDDTVDEETDEGSVRDLPTYIDRSRGMRRVINHRVRLNQLPTQMFTAWHRDSGDENAGTGSRCDN